MSVPRTLLVAAALALVSLSTAFAQDSRSLAPFIAVGTAYRATPDVTYLMAGEVELKLDVYEGISAFLARVLLR